MFGEPEVILENLESVFELERDIFLIVRDTERKS